jgi:PIN domain nuclease of toxin-antitoxin system
LFLEQTDDVDNNTVFIIKKENNVQFGITLNELMYKNFQKNSNIHDGEEDEKISRNKWLYENYVQQTQQQQQQQTNTNNNIVFPWHVYSYSFVYLLIHESNRGDNDFKLSCAKALSFLPWHFFSTKNPRLFCYFLPFLCIQANIDIFENDLKTTKFSQENFAQEKKMQVDDNKNNIVVNVNNNKNKTVKNATTLFGNRYDSKNFSIATKKSKIIAIKNNKTDIIETAASDSINNSSSYTTNQVFKKMKQHQDDEKKEVHEEGKNNNNNNNENGFINDVSCSNMEISASVEKFNEKIEAVVDIVDNSNSEKNVENNDISNLDNVAKIFVKKTKNNDPAYRMMFIECICEGFLCFFFSFDYYLKKQEKKFFKLKLKTN